jgi:two-component system, NarL family, invasion response regulator UvrY
MIRIAIADDHHQVRETWNFILSTHASFEVVGLCINGQEAIEIAGKISPDVILMDINMEPVNGIEATEVITREFPAVRVVGMSIHAEPVYVRKMLKAGALAYVTKNSSFEEVLEAIAKAHQGEPYLCKEVSKMASEANIDFTIP